MSKVSTLPVRIIREIISEPSSRRNRLFVIAEIVDNDLIVFDGNWKEITIPLSVFTPSGTGLKPDFAKMRIVDYGQAIAFGKYEASSEFCLEHAISGF